MRMLVLLFVLLFPIRAMAETPPLPTIEQVTKQLDDLYRNLGDSPTSHAKMTMTIVNRRGTRKLTMESWSKGEDTSLILIRKPARESGTATLLTDEGLWTYAPRADRLIRMPKGLLSDSWMGSDFTNDDLVRDSKYASDFETKLAWVELDGKRRLKVDFIPKKGTPVVFTKLEYILEPDTLIPVRADYFDGKKKTRSMVFSDVREVDGRKIPFQMELQTHGKKSTTTVAYESLKFGVKIKDDLFSKRGLRRAAKSK